MFDISFSELMIIGVVALLVIGPERLPKVARTLGLLLGRAQRYVNDVKTDIKREMEAGELNTLKDQFDEAAGSVKASLENASSTLRNPLEEAQQALRDTGQSLENSIKGADAESKAGANTTTTEKGLPTTDEAGKPGTSADPESGAETPSKKPSASQDGKA